jgi:PAS domain S-box-containing protein
MVVWSSLRVLLPLTIAAVVVVAIATVLAFSYRAVENDLLQAAGARAQISAEQFADLLSRSTFQRAFEVRRVARSVPVREYLQAPSEQKLKAVRVSIETLPKDGPQIVELWNNEGQQVFSVTRSQSGESGLPSGPAPTKAGVGAFQAAGHLVYADITAEVPFEVSNRASARLGMLVVRRPAAVAQTAEILNRLVGEGSLVELGNRSGDIWTDLRDVVPAPPLDSVKKGVLQYQAARDGQQLLGAPSNIRGTPWAVWVEFPRSRVLAPARTFLKRMALFALGIGIIVAAIGAVLSAWIIAPLKQLTDASEALAAGDYSRRVRLWRRSDEVGRLAAAFNAMSEQIERAYSELEGHVQQRTARLTEASALVEQHVQELNDARAVLDQFFSLSPELFAIEGRDGRYRRVNHVWQDILGWTEEELTSRPYLDFVHPDDREGTVAELDKKITKGLITLDFENRYRCRDGSYRWFSWKSAPLPGRNLICATARDVTEEKRSSQELHEHAAQLAVLNRELEAFSYSVSHDLRAPLRHISGFGGLLKDSSGAALDPKGREYLDRIVQAAERMGRLIDDLLAFSRNSRTNLILSTVHLSHLVKDAQQEVVAGISGRDVEWVMHDLPTVDADPSLLRLVFINLLSNAVKYSATRQRSRVEVGLERAESDEIVVFVRDNGVGFDMRYADKLFGVFQRLHSDGFEGTGIGLANVRRIVQRHGGRTWAEGSVDGGATFYFSLPCRGAFGEDPNLLDACEVETTAAATSH